MPLEVSCPGCEGHFRVPDTAAGKRIRCPKCKGAIDVPQVAGTFHVPPPAVIPSAGKRSASTPSDATRSAPATRPQPRPEQWFLKTEEGDEYGPATRGELEQWKAEGRITAECQLLLEGGDQWQWASEVYPDLADEEPRAAEQPAPVLTKKTAKTAAKQAVKTQPQQPVDEGPPSSRSRLVAGLLGVFLGPLGIHRFYLGYWVIGLLMLLTGGGCGIWSLVDAILVFVGKVLDADGRRLSP